MRLQSSAIRASAAIWFWGFEMETKPKEVFGVPGMLATQKAAVDAHCFGDCGKISMGGAIIDEQLGVLLVCCQTTCSYEQEVLRDYGSTTSFGEPHIVHLRALKPVEAKP